MGIIYEPRGPAREYAPLAANLFTGCGHGCHYCYGPGALRRSREDFHARTGPKIDALARFKADAAKLRGDERQVLLSFVTDPYQPCEARTRITRKAIRVLRRNKLGFTVLTKGGTRASRDFDILAGYENCSFGTSLVWTREKDARHWEPGAASVKDRIKAIRSAHDMGIRTWVSLEPVIFADQALELINEVHPIVDAWKVGKINHDTALEKGVDWLGFRAEVTALLDGLGADYYLKKSLEDL